MSTAGVDTAAILSEVTRAAEASGVFGPVQPEGDMVVCAAANSAEPAFYRVEADSGEIFVSLVMEDRWQSESVESDLVHSGDKLEELLDEELAELGYEGEGAAYQHYRSDDMLFTFRSRVPLGGKDEAGAVETVRQWLLAYEACFRQLGDMDAAGDDED